MAEDPPKKSPPSPDANWEQFTIGLPGFVDALNGGMDCIVQLAHEAGATSGAERVIAMLTGSIADNLYDVVFLCANDRRDGALRLLRTPYEKFLYAHFIAAHPEAAEAFLQFDAIQAKALLTGIEEQYHYSISDQSKAALDELVKTAQASIKRNKCKECGESLPRMWTKVTPEQMAKDAKLESIHVLAYRYATLFIHPTWRGLFDQVNEAIKLPSILAIVHRIVFETIKLQWLTFKKSKTVTGSTAEVVNRLVAAMKP